jgi:BolA protein
MSTPSSQANPVTAEAITTVLAARFQPSLLQVVDDSASHAGHAGANGTGAGTHFTVTIAAPALQGLGRVAAHRLVYDALRDQFDQGLHALALHIRP